MKLFGVIALFLSLQFTSFEANAKGNNFINFKVNAFPLIIGANDIEVDFLAGRWAFGASAYLLDFEDGTFGAEATLVGGQVSYFLGKSSNEDGWMVTLKGQTGEIDVSTVVIDAGLNLVSATAKMDVTIASAEIGYQWMWSMFNMQFRGGVASYSGSESTIQVTDASGNLYSANNAYTTGTTASLTYTLGFAF